MKKITAIAMSCVFLVAILFSGCAQEKTMKLCNADTGEYEHFVVEPYGIVDGNISDPRVDYDTSIGNVFWSVVFFTTVVAPVILLGWYAQEPQHPHPGTDSDCRR